MYKIVWIVAGLLRTEVSYEDVSVNLLLLLHLQLTGGLADVFYHHH